MGGAILSLVLARTFTFLQEIGESEIDNEARPSHACESFDDEHRLMQRPRLRLRRQQQRLIGPRRDA